ncbi:MAG: cohesin domain-containing protein [bacterium]|nr:cohesin domain-containing protein [bacterium]
MKNSNIEYRNPKQIGILKILILILFSVWCFGFGASAYAATVSTSPTSVTLSPGQSVTLTIIVDPQGTAYTAKVALSFPPNLLSVSAFSQASGWIPLSQPGYDSVDNSSGSMIKTGGATGGFSSPKVFGTVTFTSLAAGTANINVTGATQVLNASNQNTFTAGGQTVVNISSPAPAPSVTPSPTPAPNTNKTQTSPVRNLMQTTPAPATTAATTTVSATSTETAVVENSELVAQASSAENLPSLLSVFIPLMTLVAGFFLGRRLKV